MARERRADIIESMHKILLWMCDEEAYYKWIDLVPDGASEEDFEEIGRNTEAREEAWAMFRDLIAEHGNHGIYWGF